MQDNKNTTKLIPSLISGFLANVIAENSSNLMLPKNMTPGFLSVHSRVMYLTLSFTLFEQLKKRNSVLIPENLVIGAVCEASPMILAAGSGELFLRIMRVAKFKHLRLDFGHFKKFYGMALIHRASFGAFYFGGYECLKQFWDPQKPLTTGKKIVYAASASFAAIYINRIIGAFESRRIDTLWSHKLLFGRTMFAKTLALVLFDFFTQKLANW